MRRAAWAAACVGRWLGRGAAGCSPRMRWSDSPPAGAARAGAPRGPAAPAGPAAAPAGPATWPECTATPAAPAAPPATLASCPAGKPCRQAGGRWGEGRGLSELLVASGGGGGAVGGTVLTAAAGGCSAPCPRAHAAAERPPPAGCTPLQWPRPARRSLRSACARRKGRVRACRSGAAPWSQRLPGPSADRVRPPARPRHPRVLHAFHRQLVQLQLPGLQGLALLQQRLIEGDAGRDVRRGPAEGTRGPVRVPAASPGARQGPGRAHPYCRRKAWYSASGWMRAAAAAISR